LYFFRSLKRSSILTREQEIALFARIKKGDKSARDKLIRANLGLVIWIAQKCHFKNFALEDRIQEGFLGLMKAIEKFDPERGYKFSTYAHWWIRQAIIRAGQKGMIYCPVNLTVKVNRLKTVERTKNGRGLSTEEKAARLGISVKEFKKILQARVKVVSVSSAKNPDHFEERVGSILETLKDESPSPFEITLRAEFESLTKSLTKGLKEKEQQVLKLRLKGLRLKEVGEIYNISPERVRQIQRKAVKELRSRVKF